MRKNILVKTNIFVCCIILLGFVATTAIGYHSNMWIFSKSAENLVHLTGEGIYNQIDTIFSKPINISLAMANDSLLKNFLAEEPQRMDDDSYTRTMARYLSDYHEKYNFDSVFLVSTYSRRYYHFSGIDRVLIRGSAENVWHYDFLSAGEEYSLNIDNDEAAGDEITAFINCNISDDAGQSLGVVGVGFKVDSLQRLLRDYRDEFDVEAYLVNENGAIEMSAEQTSYDDGANLFELCAYPQYRETLLSKANAGESIWFSGKQGDGYVTSWYVENLDFFLIVENSTAALQQQIYGQLGKSAVIFAVVILAVLLAITAVIRRHSMQTVGLTAAREREYYETRQEAARVLYDNIFELDVTHDCAVGRNTTQYLGKFGIPQGAPCSQTLQILAAKQLKPEYQPEFLRIFSVQNVLDSYHKGIKSLTYDCELTTAGEPDHWIRIMACIFLWNEDQSVHISIYSQNIDQQKLEAQQLSERIQRDSITDLYNKFATEKFISETLARATPTEQFALFFIDIDNFKAINDTLGHAVGDYVIAQFARKIKGSFRATDLVGRVGGDEFVTFLPIPDRAWLNAKALELSAALCCRIATDSGPCDLSASIGISIYPEMGMDFETLYKNADTALYETKSKGKHGYTIFSL